MLNKRIIYIFVFFIVSPSLISIWGAEIFTKENSKLSSIIRNRKYQYTDTIIISGKGQEKTINRLNRKYSDDIPNLSLGTCVYAFVNWCNKFVQNQRDYEVFQLSNYNEDSDTIKGECSEYCDIGGSHVCVDPQTVRIPLNDKLLNGVVLIGTMREELPTQYTIFLTAVAPYSNSYFRIKTKYVFRKKLDFDYIGIRDVKKATVIVGKTYERDPDYLFNGDGSLYFQFELCWAFSKVSDIEINEIHPALLSSKVTVQSLFYPY